MKRGAYDCFKKDFYILKTRNTPFDEGDFKVIVCKKEKPHPKFHMTKIMKYAKTVTIKSVKHLKASSSEGLFVMDQSFYLSLLRRNCFFLNHLNQNFEFLHFTSNNNSFTLTHVFSPFYKEQ